MVQTKIWFKEDLRNVDFTRVTELLNHFGLSDANEQVQYATFKNSHGVLFAYADEELIGCSRVLSDGISQAAIYNVAVAEAYHHKGIGQKMVQRLIQRYRHCNIILYTHPKTVSWYQHLGFKRMNTGLAIFEAQHAAWMAAEGFTVKEEAEL
ncbi:GNAT family N-acetyltransferase [Loigolactobacillus coryniformis subsp. coryniformis]|uniref:GNAT family N-acetyltransferase n=1 Tax=Loigolactobacillus coryniformis subsp. torquens DSM 20004 = KCTC 3535 TaxID=1423822 RepID=A0A2D1KR65_9LACO|nr:GNAT family N-acetyltransferase [Loigolactobacillus coryniformis]ATO44635.1 GNAT family N-acetyltransferase [Loigolactobacillus coryniformis subsp. torquens DSM 20004 = KCTC 3535]